MPAHILIIGEHLGTGHTLGYLLEGHLETGAVVTVEDPLLKLRCPKEYLETGNSLVWLTEADLVQPGLTTELYHHEPSEEATA